MKYYLFEWQDYEELERTNVASPKKLTNKFIKLLESEFGDFIVMSDEKPKYGKNVDLEKFVIKKIKKLAEQQKGVNEEWEKAKKLTQEDLDKKYEQKVAEAALFDKIMINSNATYAPYARPIIVPLLLSDVKRETSQEKTRIKKLISWLTFGNHWA